MNRSKKAAHYGALAERAAREQYSLDIAHTSWHDAMTSDGTPVEIKAAMLNRASGKTGRFRIFEKYHRRLYREDGVYVFVTYNAVGTGISVNRMRAVEASDVRFEFYGAGGHRASRQAKVTPNRIFS